MTQQYIEQFISQALSEDLGRGDLFALIAPDRSVKASVVAKEDGIFSGAVYAQALMKHFNIHIIRMHNDGEFFSQGAHLCDIEGSYIYILQLERVLLNILAHSSGIATLCAAYMAQIQDISIKLLDTRKTRPLLRELEKYSIRNGGGCNHRFGLDTMLMLKDTHLSHIGNLCEIISTARERLPFMCPIEVECENLAYVKEAISAGADVIMCDNMSVAQVREVVAYRNATAPHIVLEASGNITLENIRAYALSGVEALSVGSLIHQARWLDLSLKIK
ncbi:carboxylating nicotinate-nucleotide diphosphorylase [Helicobacter jaachi]|uniref:nicotinate-nucleotide diphosphorylase (carboxylating) n=1 Tax=Helicobacter jaachi TaxID=1677920 RepID=A0A4V6YSA5_9HELI|nr:carboxylating nicotinate-nucleotide diphosphorylase [Helicobacter jaachi]TLD96582.1 carboxylating nicotinate-nucleotide diphosphorylase [Helicobacter jaachi]